MNEITAVITIKNRDRIRSEKCINSLLEQTIPCDIIVVNYGSDDTSWYSEVFKKVKLINVERNTEVFNKSRALNIAFKQVTTKYTLSTDIDCIFAPNFIEEILKVFATKGNAFVLCQKIDLDKEGVATDKHEHSATGSCIAINSNWLKKVHGYDEFYTLWGREDNDLVDRAVRDGFGRFWITNRTQMWHQWHEMASNDSLKENKAYYGIPGKPIKRNPDGWGEL